MTMFRYPIGTLILIVLAAVATVAWEVPDTEACGPWFPNQLLWNPETALDMPPGDLAYELGHHSSKKNKFVSLGYQSHTAFTLKTEVKDLRAALKEAGMSDSEVRGRMVALSVARERIAARQAVGTLTPALPAEFQFYLEGAGYFHAGQYGQAKERWESLLKLPPKERRWRSTWAAFMLGKQAQIVDRREAMRRHRQVRTLVAAGMKDTLGLANTSLGWEAIAALQLGRHVDAVSLYSQQAAGGDPGAIVSLDTAITHLIASPTELRRALKRADVRRLVSAWFTTKLPDTELKAGYVAWRGAFKAAGLKDAESARTLAWSDYKSGDFKGAAAWVAMAPPKDAVVLWIRAKLALRSGLTKEALVLFGQAARAMPAKALWDAPNHYSPVRPAHYILGDAGVIALHQKDFVGALDMLLRGDHWHDAAYVADRILTVAELKRYVDKHWSAKVPKSGPIRELLGRRLVRGGKYKAAAPYAAGHIRKQLAALTSHARAAKRGSKQRRAQQLWQMAKVTREWGMELMGSEMAPDFAVFGGGLEMGDTERIRAERGVAGPKPKKWSATAEEVKRAAASRVSPAKRFHYRYLAADLGWQAAAKMKDDTKQKAAILCQAGSWLKYKDPKAADRYYKALVRNNPTVQLAMTADQMRWFPAICGAP